MREEPRVPTALPDPTRGETLRNSKGWEIYSTKPDKWGVVCYQNSSGSSIACVKP
jgi:hypothetical protein